jgi:hypothetical protein
LPEIINQDPSLSNSYVMYKTQTAVPDQKSSHIICYYLSYIFHKKKIFS